MTQRHIESIMSKHQLTLQHARQYPDGASPGDPDAGMLVTFATGFASKRAGHLESLPDGGSVVADHVELAAGGTQTTIAYPEHRTVVVVHDDPANDLYVHKSHGDDELGRPVLKVKARAHKAAKRVHEQISLHVFEYASDEDYTAGLETQIPTDAARR